MKIVAHRGYSPKYPEMTAVAFEEALRLPIHGVECDIRLSKDGRVVCIHDSIVNRVSDGSGRVSVQTLQQLKELNFGAEDDPQQIVTLDELLDMVEDAPGDKHLYIETKHPLRYGRMLEEALWRTLKYRGLLDSPHIHVISFSGASLMRMSHLAPRLDRVHLRRAWTKYLHPFDPAFGHPTTRGMGLVRAKSNPSLIGKGGLPTYIFTVNEEDDVRWCLDNGVDVIATDEPEMALRVLG